MAVQDTMTPGGKWIKPPGEAPVTYVVHEAHIKRLFADGGEPVADPRPPEARLGKPVVAQPVSVPIDAFESAMREIAALKAEMERLKAEAIPNITGVVKPDAPVEQPNRGKR